MVEERTRKLEIGTGEERRKPKRNPLPKTLARERIELDVQEKDKVCPCCKAPRLSLSLTTVWR